jgi:hypothetical protein
MVNQNSWQLINETEDFSNRIAYLSNQLSALETAHGRLERFYLMQQTINRGISIN